MVTCTAGLPALSGAADHEAQQDAAILAEAAEPAVASWVLRQFQHVWSHVALYKTASAQLHVDGIDLSLTSFGARNPALNRSILRQDDNAGCSSGTHAPSAFQQHSDQQPVHQPSNLAQGPSAESAMPSNSGILLPQAASSAQASPTQPPELVHQFQPVSGTPQQGEIPPALLDTSAAEHRKVHRRHEQPGVAFKQQPATEGPAGSSREHALLASAAYLTSSEASILAAVEAGLKMTRQRHVVLRQWGLTCLLQVQPPLWLAEQTLGSTSSSASVISVHPGSPDLPVSPDSQAAFALAAQDSFAITDDSKGTQGAFQAGPDRPGEILLPSSASSTVFGRREQVLQISYVHEACWPYRDLRLPR